MRVGPPNLFYLVMEINYKETFWPSFTGVVFSPYGSNIEYLKKVAKYGFNSTQ